MSQHSPFRLPRVKPYGFLIAVLEYVVGLRRLERLYRPSTQTLSFRQLFKRAMRILKMRYKITWGDAAHIPQTGPLVLVANHPYGGAEGLAILHTILGRRQDLKILANEMVNVFPEFKHMFISVKIIGTPQDRRLFNQRAVDEAKRWVAEGHALFMFPAGEVSSWNWQKRQVIDPVWRPTVGRIVRDAKANVVPIFAEGHNGWFFQALGTVHPRLRTMRLPRELMNKKGKTIGLRIGEKIRPEDLAHLTDEQQITNHLRLQTYLLSDKADRPPKRIKLEKSLEKSTKKWQPVIEPVSVALLQADIKGLSEKKCLLQKGEMHVYCAKAHELPHVLQEIGRLRELTFRAVGEGTGKACDLDKYDQHYRHLFLWNAEKQEIVGAYRLGRVDELIMKAGINGIYSRSLFRYDHRFLTHLGTALEMGRSFVRQEYQKSLNALLMLWKGIGSYVLRHPQYRVLFGPVSISNDYKHLSRQIMANCLEMSVFDETLTELVQPRKHLKHSKRTPWDKQHLATVRDVEQLSDIVKRIEQDKGIPVLLKQYLKLQGEIIAFNVDKNFHHVLDGLIVVDLLRVDKRTLKRYFGPEGAERFIKWHEMESELDLDPV